MSYLAVCAVGDPQWPDWSLCSSVWSVWSSVPRTPDRRGAQEARRTREVRGEVRGSTDWGQLASHLPPQTSHWRYLLNTAGERKHEELWHLDWRVFWFVKQTKSWAKLHLIRQNFIPYWLYQLWFIVFMLQPRQNTTTKHETFFWELNIFRNIRHLTLTRKHCTDFLVDELIRFWQWRYLFHWRDGQGRKGSTG